MPRFTIKDLLVATTLIAVGAGALAFLFRNDEEIFHRSGMSGVLLWWLGGGACIGAGVFTPFKRPWTGVLAAFMIQALIFAVGHL
jgi:hypothetical protein